MIVYVVKELFDVDGGYGDAISEESPVVAFFNKEDAEDFIKTYKNPIVYDTPYDDLCCGHLLMQELEVMTHEDHVKQKWKWYPPMFGGPGYLGKIEDVEGEQKQDFIRSLCGALSSTNDYEGIDRLLNDKCNEYKIDEKDFVRIIGIDKDLLKERIQNIIKIGDIQKEITEMQERLPHMGSEQSERYISIISKRIEEKKKAKEEAISKLKEDLGVYVL